MICSKNSSGVASASRCFLLCCFCLMVFLYLLMEFCSEPASNTTTAAAQSMTEWRAGFCIGCCIIGAADTSPKRLFANWRRTKFPKR